MTSTASTRKHVFLGIEDLGRRYGRVSSTVYLLVKHPAFPGPVAPGRWRFDHVLAYEETAGQPDPPSPTPATATGKRPATKETVETAGSGDPQPATSDVLGPRRPSRKAA